MPRPAHPIAAEPEWPPPETPPALDEELPDSVRRENDWPKRELASEHAEVALDRKPALAQDDLAGQVTASVKRATVSAQGIEESMQWIKESAQEITASALRMKAILEREPEPATAQSKNQRAVDQSEWERGFKDGFRLGQRLP
jgi:hypothetical protein